MKPYKLVVLISTLIISLFIILPIVFVALPCRVNFDFVNNTTEVYEVIDSDENLIFEILPGNHYQIYKIGLYDGSFILNGSYVYYEIEFYDKDHWFAMKHNEEIIIEETGLTINGFLNWNHMRFEK